MKEVPAVIGRAISIELVNQRQEDLTCECVVWIRLREAPAIADEVHAGVDVHAGYRQWPVRGRRRNRTQEIRPVSKRNGSRQRPEQTRDIHVPEVQPQRR